MIKFNKKQILIIAAILFSIQLFIPGYMIFEQKQILSQGTLYNFKIRPVDPYDPFRGRYVTLSFLANTELSLVNESIELPKLERDDWIYVQLGKDKEGFATLINASREKPESNMDYLRAQVKYPSYKKGKVNITLPFNRYYAPEDKALTIETNVRQRSRQNSNDNVYVGVKVRNGKGTIEDLYFNGIPVLEFLQKNN